MRLSACIRTYLLTCLQLSKRSCLSASLSAYLHACMIILLSTCLHGTLLISMFVYVHPFLPICPATYLLVSSSVCLSFALLSTCIRSYPASCLPAHLFTSTYLLTCTSTHPTTCGGSKSNTNQNLTKYLPISTCLLAYLPMRLPA